MERLQAAIAKAREQREGLQPSPPGSERRSPRSDTAREELWAALQPIRVDAAAFRRNRLVAFDGSRAGAPYDMLRTRMLHQAVTNGWRRIALVSPHSSCGKTTTAANLAFTLARQSDVRAMFLDLDLRRGGLGRALAQSFDTGMADVLTRRVDFGDHGFRFGENVAFGFSGGRVENPSELLQSRGAREVLDEIEAAYAPDMIFFDMPPLMASDDNFGFLKNTDCALILAAAEKTNMDVIDVAERQISELTNVMGIVLNKCRYTDGAYGYEYNYY